MRIPLILFSFALIEHGAGAPTLACTGQLEDLKKLIQAKSAIKASLVTALIEQVNRIDILSNDGDTLLLMAARNGLTDVVAELMKLDPTITISAESKATASKLATAAGFKEVADILGKFDGKEMEKDEDGFTALHRAARDGDRNTVERLLKENVNVNSRVSSNESDHVTPLMLAAMNGNTEITELLLDTPGVDVNAKSDIHGGTALLYAVSEFGNAEILNLLLSTAGIDVNPKDWHGDTPLLFAVKYPRNRRVFVELLLKTKGVDVNVRSENGETPLFFSAKHGDTKAVELILKFPDVDVNARNHDGETPLHWALVNEETEVVKLLRAAGAKNSSE